MALSELSEASRLPTPNKIPSQDFELATGFLRDLYSVAAELLAEGNREGAWSLADPAFTAIFLFNALHGVVNQDGAGADGAGRATLLRDIEDNVRRLVR